MRQQRIVPHATMKHFYLGRLEMRNNDFANDVQVAMICEYLDGNQYSRMKEKSINTASPRTGWFHVLFIHSIHLSEIPC